MNDKVTLRKTPFAREVIFCKLWRGQQSANLTSFWETFQGKKIKIRIKRDTFRFQCKATAYILTEDAGWRALVTIPFPNMATLETCHSYGKGPPARQEFEADEDQLLLEAIALLAVQGEREANEY